MYAVAARDFEDFLDMLREPETSVGCLRTLLLMCKSEGRPGTDVELNRLMVGPIERQLEKRGAK